METNDQMLKNFFSENKTEIADNGFSKRVMQKLPEQTDRSWIVWVFAAIGMAFSLYLGFSSGLFVKATEIVEHVPFYYFLAGVFCFPLIGSAGFFFTQPKKYRII